MTSPQRVFLVESMLCDHNELQGIFSDFDEMIAKLSEAVRTGKIHSLNYEMNVERVEIDQFPYPDGANRSGNLIFTKDGKYKWKFGWDTTLETLRAP